MVRQICYLFCHLILKWLMHSLHEVSDGSTCALRRNLKPRIVGYSLKRGPERASAPLCGRPPRIVWDACDWPVPLWTRGAVSWASVTALLLMVSLPNRPLGPFTSLMPNYIHFWTKTRWKLLSETVARNFLPIWRVSAEILYTCCWFGQ